MEAEATAGSGSLNLRARAAAAVLLLGLVYFGSAKLGLTLAFTTPSVTAIWPPAGIALAALVLVGPRMWPGVALGAFLANVTTDVPVYTAIGITIGNTTAAVAGAYLLRQVGFRPSIERLRDLFTLLLVAVASTAIAATIGVASLSIGDSLHDSALSVWRLWWLGDMGGDLLVGTFLMVAVAYWPFREPPGRLLEAGALLACLVAVSFVVFSGTVSIAYLTFPFLIWAALRFWQPGAATAALVSAVFAVAYTANGEGQFVEASEDTSLLLALMFCVVSGVTAMVLAIVTRQRVRADQIVRNIAHGLQTGLLPPELPAIAGSETAAWYRPGELQQEVGGDFYDLFETADGEWVAVIGDVCGKGPEAASLTALGRHTVRALARHPGPPSAVLRELNAVILDQGRDDNRFMTVALARISGNGTRQLLTVSNGGHPLPLIVRADGSVEEVGAPGAGTLLGIVPEPGLTDERVAIETGDALVLYTDGLIEDPGDPGRTSEWLHTLLGRAAGGSADEIVRVLRDEALTRSEPFRDDIAIVVIRRTA